MRLLTVLLFSVLAFSVQASELSDKNIKLWIDSMPALQGWLDQHKDKLPEDNVADANFNMEEAFKRGIQDLKNAGLYNEFNSKVKSAGFSNVEQWVGVTQQITMAYTAVMLQQQPDSRAVIEEQLHSIRTSKHVPAEEKAMLEGMLLASLKMLDAVDAVPAADKQRIQPYLPQLTEQFGENDE